MKPFFQFSLLTSGAILISSVAFSQAQTLAQRAPDVVYVRREVSGSPGGRYKGGGSRSVNARADGKEPLCAATPVPLTALVPFKETYEPGYEKRTPIVDVAGFTTSDRPTFWVYVPYGNPAIPAKFSIDDEDASQTIYQTSVTLPKRAGIVGITLPKETQLQPGKRYRWFFSLNCQESSNDTTTSNPVVEAVVIREAIKPDVLGRLTPNPSLQNAAVYAQAGYWYDALTTLAVLRQQRPQDEDLTAAWKSLLAGAASDNLTPTFEKSRQNFNLDVILAQPLAN